MKRWKIRVIGFAVYACCLALGVYAAYVLVVLVWGVWRDICR